MQRRRDSELLRSKCVVVSLSLTFFAHRARACLPAAADLDVNTTKRRLSDGSRQVETSGKRRRHRRRPCIVADVSSGFQPQRRERRGPIIDTKEGEGQQPERPAAAGTREHQDNAPPSMRGLHGLLVLFSGCAIARSRLHCLNSNSHTGPNTRKVCFISFSVRAPISLVLS